MHKAENSDNSPLAIFPNQQTMLCYPFLEHMNMNNHDNKLIKIYIPLFVRNNFTQQSNNQYFWDARWTMSSTEKFIVCLFSVL